MSVLAAVRWERLLLKAIKLFVLTVEMKVSLMYTEILILLLV